jgi:hypothetical protein
MPTLQSGGSLFAMFRGALALVVAVAFTAPATADAATFLALLSPAVTVLAHRIVHRLQSSLSTGTA